MDLFACCENRTKLRYVGQTAYAASTHAHFWYMIYIGIRLVLFLNKT